MVSPPSISLPAFPQAPAMPQQLMPAQGQKPQATNTTMTPTILGSLKPPSPAQLGSNTLLGQ